MNSETNPTPNRILLVDDDIALCTILKSALERRGHQVAIAHDSQEALETSGRFKPTHAVLDLKLKEESGLFLIEPLQERIANIKIIVLTGYASIPTAVQAIKMGAINYVAKPVDVNTLLAALEGSEQEPGQEAIDSSAMSLKRLEWEHIQRILDKNDGNISATARSLGMHRRTLQRKLQKRPVKQ